MFITMNRFTINPEHWDDFENRFRQRAGLVDSEPGFIHNTVLRPADNSSDQHVILTSWASRQDFENWTKSEAFRKAHQVNFACGREYPLGDEQAGQTPKAWFVGPGKLEVFESVTDSSD